MPNDAANSNQYIEDPVGDFVSGIIEEQIGAPGGRVGPVEAEHVGGPAETESGSALLDIDADDQTAAALQQPVPGPGTVDPAQVRFEYRCKICQLSVRIPSLYRKVHELVLRDKLSYGQALNDINAYIKQHGLDLKLLNMVNMSGHFAKHIDVKQRAALVMARSSPAPIPVPAAAAASIMPMVQQAVGTEVDDFRNLDDIRRRLTFQMTKLEGQLEVIDPRTNTMKFDKWAITVYTSLISEVRACINDLNKMRQSERLMNTVVQQLLDRMTFAIIPQLLEEYTVIQEELKHAHVPDEVIKRVDERLRIKTAQVIANTARAAVTEIQRQFKLK